jgi:murein DD-endopeptidase MepM/ murein hydrolase activator NlpD
MHHHAVEDVVKAHTAERHREAAQDRETRATVAHATGAARWSRGPKEAVLLEYPFLGRWMARASRGRRAPRHGTALHDPAYAIDLVGVDAEGRPGPRGWRAATPLPPDAFIGFGRVLLAPVAGDVVAAHDQEADHAAYRSAPAGLRSLLGRGRRLRAGITDVAGNHVVIAASDRGPFVLLAHLRQGSARVGVGHHVEAGEPVGECGNSGNSIQPQVHLQVTDSLDWPTARGLPIRFRPVGEAPALPKESEIFTVSR